jgi:ATP-dependent RNA helicase DDX18/HAS1
LEKLVEKNYYLHTSARDAYRSYMMAYASHSHKDIFNVHQLDVLKVAKSFGFSTPPKVQLNLSHAGSKDQKPRPYINKSNSNNKRNYSASGHSADNPYGRNQQGGGKQWNK